MGVAELKEVCLKYLIDNVNEYTVIEYLCLPHKYDEETLTVTCIDYLCSKE